VRTTFVLAQAQFDGLLGWLDCDRDQAGQKYEEIRRGLVRFFATRGCTAPEELADLTLDRVAVKLSKIADDYIGDPSRYFYGVAKKIYREYLRRPPEHRLSSRLLPLIGVPRDEPDEEHELEYECLERSMENLDSKDRELVLEYYRYEGQARIVHRKQMAQQLGIPGPALRLRAYRVRANLMNSMDTCIRSRQADAKSALPNHCQTCRVNPPPRRNGAEGPEPFKYRDPPGTVSDSRRNK
jgi:DNA-directed RNA polymerase specialized sigma24 family protein